MSRDEYERAYALIEGTDEAKNTVARMFEGLQQNPDDHIVLDPKFVALLALLCDSGKRLAEALLAPGEVVALQRDLWREFPGVRAAFPEIG